MHQQSPSHSQICHSSTILLDQRKAHRIDPQITLLSGSEDHELGNGASNVTTPPLGSIKSATCLSCWQHSMRRLRRVRGHAALSRHMSCTIQRSGDQGSCRERRLHVPSWSTTITPGRQPWRLCDGKANSIIVARA